MYKNIEKKLLWPTPVYRFELDMTKQENDYLFDLFDSGSYNVSYQNTSNLPPPHTIQDNVVIKLYDKIKHCLRMYAHDFYPEKYIPQVVMSWSYTQDPEQHMNVHHHNRANFIATYYLRVPSDSGKLLLIDPRGGVNWFNKKEGVEYSTVFEEIEPQEGSLIIFPAYLLHEVGRNQSQEKRMCIANNVLCNEITK